MLNKKEKKFSANHNIPYYRTSHSYQNPKPIGVQGSR